MPAVYDVLIIGSGTAGQTAAYRLKDKGLAVGLVEQDQRPGGTCALRGCQAKKWFYEAPKPSPVHGTLKPPASPNRPSPVASVA